MSATGCPNCLREEFLLKFTSFLTGFISLIPYGKMYSKFYCKDKLLLLITLLLKFM